MTIDNCIKSIDRYLAKIDDFQPRIVNAESPDVLKEFIEHYQVEGNTFVSVPTYSRKDEKLRSEDLLNDLAARVGNVFLTGVTSFWKLEGEKELTYRLNTLIHREVKGHLVILCYQCRNYLNFRDPKVSRLIYDITDKATILKPKLIFVDPSFPRRTNAENTVIGIENLPNLIERTNGGKLTVITHKRKDNFPYSLYQIYEESNAYQILLRRDSSTSALSENLGTNEQWLYALQLMSDNKTWEIIIDAEIGSCKKLDSFVSDLDNYSENRLWLYFIGLKLYGAPDNWSLDYAAMKSKESAELSHWIMRSILTLSYSDKDYWKKYAVWKKLISRMIISDDEVLDYCSMVKSKGADAIYYLCDQHRVEKELIIETLSLNKDKYLHVNLKEILTHVYPDLALYLSEYHFKNELFNRYFNLYKKCKVLNTVTEEMQELVKNQAEKRDYIRLLPSRASKVEAVTMTDSFAYYIDAMGVEFLGYIMEKCRQKKLVAKVTVCHSELPSLTFCNKEFINVFDQNNVKWKKVDSLDNIKHHGAENYTYENTPFPTYIMRELEILDRVLGLIKTELLMGKYSRAILVSDHGASRLAIINPESQIIDVNSKGIHGGRVCNTTEDIQQITVAIEEGGYYALANYDRFKGGHQTGVEIHGGATLEEVMVPIVEISYQPEEIEIAVVTPEVEASFKKPPVIIFFSKTKLSNVTVAIDGTRYDVTYLDDNRFSVEMPKKTRANTYSADVYVNNNLAVTDLPFKVKKSGMTTNDIL